MQAETAIIPPTIRIPVTALRAAVHGPMYGAWVECVVRVDWPELQLTPQQIAENAMAYAMGRRAPHINRSILVVQIPYMLAQPAPEPALV